MSDKIREAFSRIYPKIADGVRPSAFSIFKEGYEAGVALAQQPAPAVPDGWKLAPVEPTIDMEDAGRKAASGFMRLGEAGRVFRAMLAASPAAPAPAPAAQEPVAWLRDDGDGDLEFSADGYGFPVYAAPPVAEQPYSTTSDKYRAELYDEVWSQARLIGFGNVTDALAELQRMKLAEQPVPRELLGKEGADHE